MCIETDKIIDFTIANEKNILIREEYLKDLHTSDHFGLLAILNCNIGKPKIKKPMLKFNRKKIITNLKIRDKI